MEIRQKKNWPLASRLSRSLKVIGSDAVRSTYDFLSLIRSNHGLISYRFWDKWRFRSKIAKLSHPVYLKPPLSEFCLEFCNGGSTFQKPESCPTRRWEEFDDMCIHFDTIQYQSVTDGQTDKFAITIPLSGMLRREENGFMNFTKLLKYRWERRLKTNQYSKTNAQSEIDIGILRFYGWY